MRKLTRIFTKCVRKRKEKNDEESLGEGDKFGKGIGMEENGDRGIRQHQRPSPRWREPLVEEFHHHRRPDSPPLEQQQPTSAATAEAEASASSNGRDWGTGISRERTAAEEEAEDEPPFFSEDFYRAFPHLRPSSSRSGRRPHFFPSAMRSRLWADDPPEFSSYLDRFDRNWRNDPFWRDLYPRWAEPIFKDGIDVKTQIVNNQERFAVEIDCYQFRPEEIQVKTMDDTLLIEGRHEDVRDRDNYTKMYFVRKYQLPSDVDPYTISSHVDSSGRLSVDARKRHLAIEGRERSIPIESPSGRRLFGGSRSSSYSPRDHHLDSGRGSANDYYRATENHLSPNPNKSNGYRTEFESRQTDGNGMRHEARREEFREEVRRSGSAANLLPPPSPLLRAESRLSDRLGGAAGETREAHQFRRASSQSRNEYRQFSNGGSGTEHLLRPSEEMGGRTSAAYGRDVPIQRD